MSFKHMTKHVGVRCLIISCIWLSILLMMVMLLPLVVFESLPSCKTKGSTKILVVPEWQSPNVVTDREHEKLHDTSYGEPRRFVPMGTATFLFVHFSTHRVEPNSFAIVGLGAKSVFLHNDPQFACSWHPHDHDQSVSSSDRIIHCNGSFIQPSQNHVSYGKEYVGTVVYCTFDAPVGSDGAGGHLVITATHGTKYHLGLEDVSFVAKTEAPGEFNASHFRPPYPLEHVYCGAPLHGWLNPQRVREWMVYHSRFLGERSHFFLYDAGGIDEDVRRVLRPWLAEGRVTVSNVRQGERYNSHYYNQYVILNDCLFRSRTLAPWTWIFDVDEYVYIPRRYSSVNQVIEKIQKNFWGKRLQRISMVQNPIDHEHCLRLEDPSKQNSAWAMERMVYRRIQITEIGGQMDRKSVVRADSALAVGPHEPVEMKMPPGATRVPEVTSWEHELLQYYHYRDTIGKKESEVCQELLERDVNATSFHQVQHQFDGSMMALAEKTKRFEYETMGSDLAFDKKSRAAT